MAEKSKTNDAVAILHRRFYEGKPVRLKDLEEAGRTKTSRAQSAS